MQNAKRTSAGWRSLRTAIAASLLIAGSAGLSGCGRHDNPGYIIFSWVLVKASESDPSKAPAQRCSDVGVDKIRLEIGAALSSEYACTSMAAQSLTVPAGYYHVRVSALGPNSSFIQSVEFPNMYVFGPSPLGQVRLAVP